MTLRIVYYNMVSNVLRIAILYNDMFLAFEQITNSGFSIALALFIRMDNNTLSEKLY